MKKIKNWLLSKALKFRWLQSAKTTVLGVIILLDAVKEFLASIAIGDPDISTISARYEQILIAIALLFARDKADPIRDAERARGIEPAKSPGKFPFHLVPVALALVLCGGAVSCRSVDANGHTRGERTLYEGVKRIAGTVAVQYSDGKLCLCVAPGSVFTPTESRTTDAKDQDRIDTTIHLEPK